MPENLTPSTSTAPRRSHRAALITTAIVVALGASLAFAPVRAIAVQALSIFRVQKIATVSITSDDMQKITEGLAKGDSHVSLDELGDVWVEGKPSLGSEEATLTTLAAAQAAVDFPVLTPASVDGTQSVFVQPGATFKFKLHVDKVNELLRYYGAEKLFSSSLDGKTFEIKMPPTVFLAYGKNGLGFAQDYESGMMAEGESSSITPDPTSQDVFIAQTRGPQLSVPDGVNPLEIRDVLLGLPFLPANVRTQLAGVSDWQHTLLIPNISGSTRDITVAGNPGVVISESKGDPDMPKEPGYQPMVAVMWQQDGVLRAVSATTEAKALALAESLAK